MPEQLFLLANLVIMVAYAAITIAVMVPVSRAGQLRTNKLAVATALIFFSCAVGHGMHAFLAYRGITQAADTAHLGHALSEGWSWPSAVWDLFTAGVGIYYWTLRRSYGVLLGNGAIFISPGEQRRLDEADARERAARDVAESRLVTLTAVVAHTDAAIIGLDVAGNVTAWNPGAEKVFGWTADEMIGQPVSLLSDESGHEQQVASQERVRNGEPHVTYEARRLRKDGSPVELSINVAAVRDSTGQVTGTSVVARDISAAKEAADQQRALEERTNQQQRMESLGKLAGGIAHDFNNILAIIVNYTEFAAEAAEQDSAVRADLVHVRTAADRAMNLTRQLLTFTRGDTIQPQDVDLDAAITEVRAMLDRTIGADIALFARPPRRPLVVHGDPGQLQQVLLNLAINARDAMPDGGTLVIEADEAELDGQELNMRPAVAAGRYARIQVSDTGEGMSAEVAAHIFEPFYTTKPRGKGTGLGLATVYGIVAEAGGSINVFSEPGVGTTFRIYLPLSTAPAGPSVTGTRLIVPPKGDGQRILVVEDEEPLARVVHRILTGNGYRVMAAVTGAEAYQTFLAKGCDALLTDVIMPEMSGPRLAELVHEREPGLPVVYMSGYSNGLLGSTRVLDPDIPFLEKPFASGELLHKLHEALSLAPSGLRRTGAPR
ncbi:hybrid sensor histidine kinase/response regulator [Paractinoplanes durhamensis]|uniref:histidine kinase n=1 Tax=Paractinoplanes durhamensis TaxID=113563 RepID=A0ABQ3YWR0_9ACTN|nr:ATP-binding protein [Actinoplanes durhamensis]GIE02008.1 histidine kinase [Actinoplanes durhamensis]